MRTFDFFGCYIGFTWLKPDAPLIHHYEINEIDEECRTSRAYFVRLWPLRCAVALGRWKQTGMNPEQMFAHVFSARELNLYDEDGVIDPRFAQAVRGIIADKAEDPDEEWEILRMTGLDK